MAADLLQPSMISRLQGAQEPLQLCHAGAAPVPLLSAAEVSTDLGAPPASPPGAPTAVQAVQAIMLRTHKRVAGVKSEGHDSNAARAASGYRLQGLVSSPGRVAAALLRAGAAKLECTRVDARLAQQPNLIYLLAGVITKVVQP